MLITFSRMENTVLGNALEGVPEESSEEGEKQNDSKIESADNLDGSYLKSFVCWLKLLTLFLFFSYMLEARHHIYTKNLQMDLSIFCSSQYIMKA